MSNAVYVVLCALVAIVIGFVVGLAVLWIGLSVGIPAAGVGIGALFAGFLSAVSVGMTIATSND